MNEKELISGWLEKNREQMALHISLEGQWHPLHVFKWKLAGQFFHTLLADWNKLKGSRARKPMEDFYTIAEERGLIIFTGFFQEAVDADGNDINLQENGIIVQVAGQDYIYYKAKGKRYLKPFYGDLSEGDLDASSCFHCTMEARDVFDFLDYYTQFVEMAVKMWKEMEFEIKKEVDVSALSLPVIEAFLKKEFEDQSVKYFTRAEGSEVKIYINIVKELWYKGPITIDTMEDIARYTPYAILRPDDKKILGPGFKVVKDLRNEIENEYIKYWKL